MLADADDDSFLYTDDCFDEIDQLMLGQIPEIGVSVSSNTLVQSQT